MNARTLKHLERLFAAEIKGQDMQLAPRTADKLEREGLIFRVVRATCENEPEELP